MHHAFPFRETEVERHAFFEAMLEVDLEAEEIYVELMRFDLVAAAQDGDRAAECHAITLVWDAVSLSTSRDVCRSCYGSGVSEKDAVGRMLRGFRAAATRQCELRRAEGPSPEQAVAEAIAAAAALSAAGKWPAPRDSVSERAVERVRHRWVRIVQNARQTTKG